MDITDKDVPIKFKGKTVGLADVCGDGTVVNVRLEKDFYIENESTSAYSIVTDPPKCKSLHQ